MFFKKKEEFVYRENDIFIHDTNKNFLNDCTLKKLNNYCKRINAPFMYNYSYIGGDIATKFINSIIIILPTVMEKVSLDMISDALKYGLLIILKKLVPKKKEKPTLCIEYDNHHIKVDYSFKMTKKEQTKLVNETIELVKDVIKKTQ